MDTKTLALIALVVGAGAYYWYMTQGKAKVRQMVVDPSTPIGAVVIGLQRAGWSVDEKGNATPPSGSAEQAYNVYGGALR